MKPKLSQLLRFGKRRPVTLPGTPIFDAMPAGAEVVERDVRVTVCPGWTHDPRFQCAPGEQPFGAGFSAMGPGRYLGDA